MNIDAQNAQFQKITNKFNEVSSIYDIHNIRIRAMITYFENIKSIYSKMLGKKEKFQITRNSFGKQISVDLNSPIAPGNPTFQLKFAETLTDLSKLVILELELAHKQIKEPVIQYLNQLATTREKKFKEITSKYNDALDTYQKALSNYKNAQQNLASSLTKLDQTQQNWETQQNQQKTPQKSGFNLFNKLKPSKSKTDISGAVQNYRKCIRATENSVYALNSAYSILLKTANEGIVSFQSDATERHRTLKYSLLQLSTIYEKSAAYDNFLPECKNKVFQNDEESYTQSWRDDFIHYVQKVQIARLPLHSIVFDPKSNPSQIIQQTKCYDSPLGFATVIQNFPFLRERYLTQPDLDNETKRKSANISSPSNQDDQPASQEPRRQSFHVGSQPKTQNTQPSILTIEKDDKNKKYLMQVKEGQRVYYFNSLLDEWTLVSTSPNGPRKYVLSTCLKADEPTNSNGAAIVMRIILNQGENYLRTTPGELLTIANRECDDDNFLCTNINGETGLVKKDCLIIFNE